MGRHRGARRGAPVRTGLLGVSAAVAVGATAVAAGLLPGGDTFTVGGTPAAEQRVEAQQAPSLNTQGGSSVKPESPGTTAPAGNGRAASRSAAPSPKPSVTQTTAGPKTTRSPAKTPAPEVTRTTKAPAKAASPKPARTVRPTQAPKPAPTTQAPKPAPQPTLRSVSAREAAAEAEVLRLVNVERATVGCSPVRSDAGLASLAGAFSADMAARNFFDHTDPDGATPWSRAAKAGITSLGGENIAQGQVDAAAVMRSWMASEGHRANILNCSYTALGVGVHFGAGGPWWTQDFGF
ncbi:CAP domain-containing protein [Streptomyces sp. NPDC053493]|uniref:CAP domain-containing protein n=1 Tax=Streptomyces sp. NPDC053493 TaxID=3365705 RepID=UPI0037D4A42B